MTVGEAFILVDIMPMVILMIAIVIVTGIKEKRGKHMADKIYEYNGKYYSKTDYSCEVDDDKWGGDLYDLYFDASHGDCSGELCESTVYYSAYNPEETYEDSDELVEDFFDDCTVELDQIRSVKDLRANTVEEFAEAYKNFMNESGCSIHENCIDGDCIDCFKDEWLKGAE